MGKHWGGLVRIGAAGAVALAMVALVGCASRGERRLTKEMGEQMLEAARGAGYISQSTGLDDPTDAIAAYARSILPELERSGVSPQGDSGWIPGSPDSASQLRLVGIEPFPDADWDDAVGALVLGTSLDIVSAKDERDYCRRFKFDRWGVVGLSREVRCPDPLAAVTPPPDTRPIIPDGAEAAALAALAGAGDSTADDLAAALTEQLDPLAGDLPLAEVQVARHGERIGLAMRDADDCLLVRAENGVAERLHPPAVLLQDGELGCFASTALLPDEAFRPPH